METSRDKLKHDYNTPVISKKVKCSRKHKVWTIAEVRDLIDGVSQYGVGKWTEIKRLLFSSSAHRTPVDLKDKWRNLIKASCAEEQRKKEVGWFYTPRMFAEIELLGFTCLDNSPPEESISFLAALTTLCLSCCKLPTTVWDFPALTSIQLDGVNLPANLNDMFSALVNLQNLTLFLTDQQEYLISCPPQLLNLSTRARLEHYYPHSCKSIVVSAPKLRNFTSFGIFIATVGVPELENVNVRLQGLFHKMDLTRMKQIPRRLTYMLPGLGNAKNLIFDLDSIKKGKKKPVHLVDVPGYSRLQIKLDDFLTQAAGVVFVVDAVEFLPKCLLWAFHVTRSKVVHSVGSLFDNLLRVVMDH